MRTFEKIKGASVFIEGSNSRLLGIISDLTYSPTEGRITGYWIHKYRWWSKKHVIPFMSISDRTKDGFFVKETSPFYHIHSKDKRLTHGKDRLFGRTVREEDGSIVGIVEDVLFLPNSGKIIGYQVTEGLYEDWKHGIKVIKKEHLVGKSSEKLLLTTE